MAQHDFIIAFPSFAPYMDLLDTLLLTEVQQLDRHLTVRYHEGRAIALGWGHSIGAGP